ncbi:MAG TPA: DUF58 domain-containing protein [Thermoleophilaceae bacterium]
MTRALGAVLLGLVLLAGGLGLGAPSLYVPAVALVLLGAGAAAWVAMASAGAGLERTTGPHTVEEGAAWPLLLDVRRGLAPPPGGELTEPLLGRPLPAGPGSPARVRVEVRFEHRGRRVLEPARLSIRDPLGLAERTMESAAGELLVLPRVEPVLAPGAAATGRAGGQAPRPKAESAELEIDGLRPYRPGMPASRIHWPAVARRGELVERRLVADSDSRPLVVLDARRPPDEDALDRAVRAAASLTVHLARGGGCALLLPGDRRATEVDPELRAWPALHVRLALVEPDPRAPAGRVERAGAVYWVAACPGVPAGLARAAARERWLVTPALDGAPAGGFGVAGCTGRRLGTAASRAA